MRVSRFIAGSGVSSLDHRSCLGQGLQGGIDHRGSLKTGAVAFALTFDRHEAGGERLAELQRERRHVADYALELLRRFRERPSTMGCASRRSSKDTF